MIIRIERDMAETYLRFFDSINNRYEGKLLDGEQEKEFKKILQRVIDGEDMVIQLGENRNWITDSNNVSYIFPEQIISPFHE